MRHAGVIGDPVAHSLSPHMHNAAFEALGVNATYELWETVAADLPSRVESLRHAQMLGANVTVPHKQAVMPLVDEVSDTARRIGAVNTIIRDGERLIGDNTDAYGFRQSIEATFPASGRETAVVLGAGGASRAVIVALREMGYAHIVLANRTLARAEALGDEFGVEALPWDEVVDSAFPAASLLVNATSLGWHDEMPVEPAALDRLPATALVMDLTYRETPLLRAAGDRGLGALDGLGMLIYQGARAFELWLGQPAPVDVMRGAVVAEQSRRA
jgi:shikimate dehydrogenase